MGFRVGPDSFLLTNIFIVTSMFHQSVMAAASGATFVSSMSERSARNAHFHLTPAAAVRRLRSPFARLVTGHASHRRLTRISATLSEERTAAAAETTDAAEDTTASTASSKSWVIRGEQGFNIFVTEFFIAILDGLYAKRDYARFYVLETIARVPYFAFVSVLHMYETFGWWRRADYLKVHFAESWNELHHLLVMEALGGDERWFDRFLAQHIAVAYYILTSLMYAVSPRMAYHFSECVEKHAHSTYDKFIKAHGEELKHLPAPQVAVDYYTKGDLYMFDEFQTHRPPESRRPKVDNLYDVFVNIREDEWEHCKTMHACQVRGNLRSPHAAASTGPDEGDQLDEVPPAECTGIVECATTATSYAERVHRNS